MGFTLPSQIRFLVGWFVLSALGLSTFAQAPSSLLPIPDAAAQSKAEKLIAEIFKPYPPPAPADQNKLAIKLLAQGKETVNEPATRYVLFRDALKFATATSDLDTAVAAIDQIAKSFAANTRAMMVDTLHKIASSASKPDAARILLFPVLRVSNNALKEHNFDLALEAANAADLILRASKDSSMDAIVKEHRKTVNDVHAAYETALSSLEKLAKEPEDATANLTAGKFLSFISNQWDLGLPMLAKSSDATLKTLAKDDLASEADSQRRVADAWWDLSRSQTGIARQNIVQHSAICYAKALTSLNGLNKALVQKRIDEINAAPRQGMAKVIDLLPLVDPAADAVNGKWALKAGALVSDNGLVSRLQLPYQPPAEYDFRIEFTRQGGNSCAVQNLVANGHDFAFILGLQNQFFGFECINSDSILKNPSTAQIPNGLENNRQYTSIVQVRNGGVCTFLNGKLISEYKTDYKDLSSPFWGLHDTKALGVGSHQSQVAFYTIVVIEVSGPGKLTR